MSIFDEEIPVTHVDQVGFDRQYKDYTIENIDSERDGYELHLNDGGTIYVNKSEINFPILISDSVRIYGKGFGFRYRGLAIQNQMVHYKSEEEFEAYSKYEIEKSNRNDKVKNWMKRDETEQRIKALPKTLRDRMEGFIRKDKDFLLSDGLQYELFIYEEAVVFADTLKTVKALDEWKNLKYNLQKQMVPVNEGHSGNTFYSAIMFAKMLLEEREKKP